MTANGLLQIVLYVVVLLALAKPLGAYMAVSTRTAVLPRRALGWLERLIYRGAGVRPAEEMGWKTYAASMLIFNLFGLLAVYLLQRLQGVLPLNPRPGRGLERLLVQHGRELATNTNWQGYGGESTMSYLTQMLALTVPELPVGRHRHGGPDRAHPGLRAALGRHHRQLLGRHDADHALHPAAAVLRAGARARLPGDDADLRPVRQGHGGAVDPVRRAGHRQGRQAGAGRQGPAHDEEGHAGRAGHRRRARRLADRHQAAGHERRRLLQRELGASVRESHAALQLPGAALDPGDLGRALLHVRRHGRRHAPGLAVLAR